MHALIVTLGSHGDVHPFLAIGRALTARGHRCTIVTDPYFTNDVASAGLELDPLPGAVCFAELVRHPHLFHRFHGPVLLMRQFESATRPVVEALRRGIRAHGPDVILAHHIVLPAGWVAAQHGVPCAIAVLAPFAWNAPDDPVPFLQLAPGAWRRRAARVLGRALDPALRSLGDAWANRMRVSAGLPAARDPLWGSFRGGDLNLALWSAAFRPPLPGDPPQGAICGFPWYDGDPGARLEPDLERFLAAGEPPVVFTLGSAAVHTAGNFFSLAARAAARLGRRAVLVIGRGNAPPAGLTRDIVAVPWAPHSRLFPRALVNVHHGGIGSTAQALRAGRPTLVIPHAYDQFNNAVRVATLGAGLVLARHRVTVARLAEALERCIADDLIAARARALGRRVDDDDGAETAASHLERLVASAWYAAA